MRFSWLEKRCSEAAHCSKMDPSTKSYNNETMTAHVPRSSTSESLYNKDQLNGLQKVFTRTFFFVTYPQYRLAESCLSF